MYVHMYMYAYCTEQVSSSMSLQNKLVNIDVQNLAQQLIQLHDKLTIKVSIFIDYT